MNWRKKESPSQFLDVLLALGLRSERSCFPLTRRGNCSFFFFFFNFFLFIFFFFSPSPSNLRFPVTGPGVSHSFFIIVLETEASIPCL